METKTFIRFLFFAILVFVISSCENSKESKQEKHNSKEISDLFKTLKAANETIEKAMYDNDYKTLLKFYSDSVIVYPNFYSVLKGIRAVEANYLEQERAGIRINSFRATGDSTWVCGNNIFEYGKYGISYISNESKHPSAISGSYFIIWESQKNNSLLIKYMISNLDYDPCRN